MSAVAKRLMDQDATWYGGRRRSRRLCVRWGPSSPNRKRPQPPPSFGPCLLWSNGWMDQEFKMPLGMEVNLSRVYVVLDGVPAPPYRKGASFWPMSTVAKTAGWIKTPLGTKVVLGPGHIVLYGDPAHPMKGAQQHPLFSVHVYCGHGCPSQLLLSSCNILQV